ncbi:hypothetical protein COCOR_02788 [Corallococcus coralloides DSM 2259]|uniref:Uncharacterized protein n=1 Tax=Corallococcus coralloides (strain ATCC 25202 / DSM 2259 / NBRC 100086 / M2) TaxID=1144275 RepID=H8MWZ6_CORCM|nr:hypothetical protein [Corallococcus coralloides]AFE04820.1 hypothetical protein COCOR_02788 [Corallococcus coralloides DSM 2259]
MSTLDWLTYAAKRSTTEHGLLGQVFATYQSLEDCSRDALAEELGCDEQTLNMLSLCRRPSGDAFAEQVKMLCGRFGLEPFALVNVLRQVEIMGSDSGEVETRLHPTGTLQLAARDRRKKDEPAT